MPFDDDIDYSILSDPNPFDDRYTPGPVMGPQLRPEAKMSRPTTRARYNLDNPEKIGPQWRRVYRGYTAPLEDIDLSKAGIHWSDNPEVSEDFANNMYDTPKANRTVIEGLVHNDDIIHPSTPEWQAMGGGISIFDTDAPEGEREVTVRPGGMVHFNRAHHFGVGKNKDGYEYKGPEDINATGSA